jgi:endonuclease III
MVPGKNFIEYLFSSIKKYNTQKYIAFLKSNQQKDKILSKNHHMLMIMWIMTPQYDADKASLVPFYLEERLGSCDMRFLASLSLFKIEQAMTQPTIIHRFPKKRAEYLHSMAQFITARYSGDPSNIWNNASSSEITKRLLEIKGFGPKLASMVPINLIRNLGYKLANQETMDIAVDVHVARVLKRTGICRAEADYSEMASTARKIAEQEDHFAMELDLPLWATGKFFCHEVNPDCSNCLLGDCCPKIIGVDIMPRLCSLNDCT